MKKTELFPLKVYIFTSNGLNFYSALLMNGLPLLTSCTVLKNCSTNHHPKFAIDSLLTVQRVITKCVVLC